MVKWIAAVLLLFSGLGSTAEAGSLFRVRDQVSGREASTLPYEHIGDYQSAHGETLVDFLERVRPDLRAFSDRTGFEACAEIARSVDGATFGLVLGSSHSHLGCAIYTDKLPPGMLATGESIHSHGRPGSFNMSKVDKLFSGIDAPGIVPCHGETLDHFSPTDYAGGPGYLAAPNTLLYQNGQSGSEAVAAP